MGVRPSMGTAGDAYDNAMAESFFATLECELIARRTWRSKAEAKMAVFTWIEGWYNPRRRGLRSEEHTSELQSLMRNSYAVFCLKKKTTTIYHTTIYI